MIIRKKTSENDCKMTEHIRNIIIMKKTTSTRAMAEMTEILLVCRKTENEGSDRQCQKY